MNTPSPISEKDSKKKLSGCTSVKGSLVSELDKNVNGRTKGGTPFQSIETFTFSSDRSGSVKARLSENVDSGYYQLENDNRDNFY